MERKRADKREGKPVMSAHKKQERERRCGKCLRSFSHNSLHAASLHCPTQASRRSGLKLDPQLSVFRSMSSRRSSSGNDSFLISVRNSSVCRVSPLQLLQHSLDLHHTHLSVHSPQPCFPNITVTYDKSAISKPFSRFCRKLNATQIA